MDNGQIPGSGTEQDAHASGTNPFLAPILQRAAANPDSLFAVYHEEGVWSAVTLERLVRRALQFVTLYRTLGAAPGETILLILRHGLDGHAAFLGGMLAGLIPSYLPYPNARHDHTLYWAQHRAVLALRRPAVVLVYDELHQAILALAEGTRIAVAPLSAVDRHDPAALPPALAGADSVGLLQHSSGTTGLKKGVALSYGAIARQLAAYRDALRFDGAEARIASWLPLYHDMGLISSFLLPLWVGAPIISIDPFTWVSAPALFLDAIHEYRATHAWLPNFAFLHLARRVRDPETWDLRSLRALISCSEPCKPEAFDAFLARFQASGIEPHMLQTCYAMAETVFAVSQSNPGAPPRRVRVDRKAIEQLGRLGVPDTAEDAVTLLSNGRPIAGCAVRILRAGAFVGEHEIGEICVSARYMFSGYHENPEATAASFHGTWYRTGDLGFLSGGEVFIVGRLKDIIIVNGKNIFAHDVEAAVSRIPGVKPGRSVAFGRFSQRIGSEELIVVAERAGEPRDDGRVMAEINRAVVEEVGVPCSDVRLVAVGWLVKTTSGKVSRADNATRYTAPPGPTA